MDQDDAPMNLDTPIVTKPSSNGLSNICATQSTADSLSGLPPVDPLIQSPFLDQLLQIPDADGQMKLTVFSYIFCKVSRDPNWRWILKDDFKDLLKCEDLLRQSDDFDTLLRQCIEKKEFERLFKDPILLRNPQKQPARGFPIDIAGHLAAAFKSDYIGDNHKLMLDAIGAMASTSHYTRILPVVQSSGTGKSKTVYKIAEDRIVIQMCLREANAEGTISYPASDAPLRVYFNRAPPADYEAECKNYLRGFLTSLFKNFHQKLETFADEIRKTSSPVSYKRLVQECFKLFDSKDNDTDEGERHRFYAKVVEEARATKDPKALTAALNSIDVFFQTVCTDSLDLPLIMSIDEVHVLYETSKNSKKSLYSLLKSVLNELLDHKFCVVALTTVMSISHIAPSKQIAPSYRGTHSRLLEAVPFTELPFDLFDTVDPLKPDQVPPEDAGKLEFLVKFGRPLWRSMYNFSTDGAHPSASRIIDIAKEKLSGCQLPLRDACGLNSTSIAILSTRLFLELPPTTSTARHYEKKLVENHLRVVYSVHEDREVFMTGSSSEPIVAEAAAEMMNLKISEESYIKMWDILLQYVESGLAAQGNIGELIGQAISISAMDKAINDLPPDAQSELKYHSRVPVNAYFKTLLTDEAWEKLRVSVPANWEVLTESAGAMNFETAFEHASLHFSHYSPANDASPLTKYYFWALWLRGTAVLCKDRQISTNRFSPIFFSDRGHGKPSPDSMSSIFEQDKTSSDQRPDKTSYQSAEQLGTFDGATDVPYIAVAHCYGVVHGQGVSATQSRDRRTSKQKNSEAPRYQLDISGLQSYRLLDEEVKKTIRNIIAISKSILLNHHPRRNGVSAVLRMRPFFSGHANNTTWFGGLPSNLEPTEKEPTERIRQQLENSTAGTSKQHSTRGKKRKR